MSPMIRVVFWMLQVAAIAGLLGGVQGVAAQDTRASRDSPARSAPLDLVRLTNGAEYRGTLAERVPESHVIILTVIGETKRFAWSEVAYAGAFSEAPPASSLQPREPQPSQPPAAETTDTQRAAGESPVTLDLQATRPGLLFHARGPGHSGILCAPPCTTKLEPGAYTLGLSAGGRAPIWDDNASDLTSDERLVGHYDSRRGLRIAGGVIAGAGVLTGLSLIVAGARARGTCHVAASVMAAEEACRESAVGKPYIVSGVLVGLASIAVGIAMISRRDTAHIDRPFVAPPIVETAAATSTPPRAPVEVGDVKLAPDVWRCVPNEKEVTLLIRVDDESRISAVSADSSLNADSRRCLRESLTGRPVSKRTPRSSKVRFSR